VVAIGVGVTVSGAVLTGDLSRPWQGSSLGLGYALIDIGLGAIIVFVFLDALVTRQKTVSEASEREKEQAIWNPVRKQVNGLVSTCLSEILADIVLITNSSQVVSVPFDASQDEIMRLQNQETLKELKRLAVDKSTLVSNLETGPASLLDGGYKKLFLEQGRRLGNLQNRYWSRFLDPQCVALLIDLEQQLYQLDTKIAIVKRERQADENGTLQPISRAVATINIDQLYEILQHIVTLLVDGLDKGLVKFG